MESLLAQWFKLGSPRLGDRKGVVGVAGVDLIKAVASGDQDALRELYRVHSHELFVFILRRLGDRQLAEETLQDVMLAVWRGAKSYRADASVRTWLYSIAHRRVSSAMRKLPKRVTAYDPDLMESHAAGPADRLEVSDLEAAIVAALSELPERQRLVIELIYLHGLTGPEAARVLGVPVGTVKSRQNRALRALRPLLEEFDDVY